jgi:hypothetical protein
MVQDVVAWLPHSPMLAFDILPSYGGGNGCLLASCAAPPWATEEIPLTQFSFLIFFVGTRNTSSNQICLQMISASHWEEEY